ncbi:MAG: DNA methyltransferase [Chloroflexi bacterium]|nr:DNA methyltransferase [Chloroflexota bacterium]
MDTLDNMDWQGATGGAVQRQGAFELGGMSTENWMRVNLQNEKTISVILGNPPYNDSATLWGDGGANRAYPEIDRRIRDTYIKEGTAQRTHQYDMYKRFLRWASDRLDDDGVIAFITNRAYIDARQDDGFRKIAAQEFSDIYVMDLGSDVRRNPKISGTTHNVFGIQTGVAIGFFVREKAKLGKCGIHYAKREDAEIAVDKLAYLGKSDLGDIEFQDIKPDKHDNWLNQSNRDFDRLIVLADRKTKFAKTADDEQAMFRLFSNGVKTNRDDWVYDFDVHSLRNKALFFADTYNRLLDNNDHSYSPKIKWSRDLRNEFRRGRRIVYSEANRIHSLYRPFTLKHHFANFTMNDVLTRNHYEIFGSNLSQSNGIIAFSGIASSKPFSVLATDNLFGFDTLEKTQCLPLYRYTDDGERVSNITDWGLQRINAHYRKEFGDHFEEVVGGPAITAEDVFAYTYAVLHDPAYRHDYAVDLLREFPRLPLYHDWAAWVKMGRELLDLHINFERADPYPLERVDKVLSPSDSTPKPMLRANARDKERGEIHIDSDTVLRGVPADAWRYMLGNRSALEWVLDQYKEKKPRDPTIRERFNTYRFADYKEQVIDLLRRVCTVSVRTMDVVDGMAYWEDGYLIVFGDRDKHEWTMMGLQSLFSEQEDDEWLAEWASMPDIREEGE